MVMCPITLLNGITTQKTETWNWQTVHK